MPEPPKLPSEPLFVSSDGLMMAGVGPDGIPWMKIPHTGYKPSDITIHEYTMYTLKDYMRDETYFRECWP